MRMLGLGDSILLQINHILKDCYEEKGMVYEHLGKQDNHAHWHDQGVTNVGVTENIIPLLKRMAKDHQTYDVLIAHLGLHDIKVSHLTKTPQTSLTHYEEVLTDAFTEAKVVADHVFWITIPTILDEVHNGYHLSMARFDSDAKRYNDIMRRLALRFGIHVIDTHRDHPLRPADLADHVHLNEASEQTYAQLIVERVMAVLAKETKTS